MPDEDNNLLWWLFSFRVKKMTTSPASQELSCKIIKKDINLPSLMPDEDKIWWLLQNDDVTWKRSILSSHEVSYSRGDWLWNSLNNDAKDRKRKCCQGWYYVESWTKKKKELNKSKQKLCVDLVPRLSLLCVAEKRAWENWLCIRACSQVIRTCVNQNGGQGSLWYLEMIWMRFWMSWSKNNVDKRNFQRQWLV